ncbi:MAG: hypothetical protein J6L23_03460 [Clostridia bacterium]|mgnify:CR=1 FL=1|nr:hypothetical protein [Clostridia bacterium]
MSIFTVRRPARITVLNVETRLFSTKVSYLATYSDNTTKTFRKKVKELRAAFVYGSQPRIVKVEYVFKDFPRLLGFAGNIVFLITLSDRTEDLVRAKEGTKRCNELLSQALSTEHIKFDTDTADFTEEPKKADTSSTYCANEDRREMVTDLDIPIEILPNLYSLSVSNVAIKHHQTWEKGNKTFDYATLKCRVNYRLNGRKEGKRYIIVTSYDEKDGVLDVYGDYDKYHFTEAGNEFIEICFNYYDKHPVSKIGISIKES